MPDPREIEIFDTATHTRPWPKSEADLDAIVANFDPTFHDAPVKIGHEQAGEDAHGWVRSLRRAGTKLLATFRNVSDDLKERIRTGRIATRSVELWRDLQGRGPRLRAVAFLGASVPECKGLAPIADSDFSDDDAIVFFSDADFGSGKPTEEATDMDLEKRIKELEDENAALQAQVAKFQEGERFAELEAERDALKNQVKDLESKVTTFAERDAVREKADRAREARERFEQLSKDGQVTPAQQEALVAQFAELPKAAADALFETLQKGPKLVTFGAESHDPAPAAQAGTPERSATHEKVLKYQETHPDATYEEALIAVEQ